MALSTMTILRDRMIFHNQVHRMDGTAATTQMLPTQLKGKKHQIGCQT